MADQMSQKEKYERLLSAVRTQAELGALTMAGAKGVLQEIGEDRETSEEEDE